MEELQDAIEDAQYLTAMHDETPKPTTAWPKYRDEELHAFVARQRAENPLQVELEGMCAGCLGFYMVRAEPFCCLIFSFLMHNVLAIMIQSRESILHLSL